MNPSSPLSLPSSRTLLTSLINQLSLLQPQEHQLPTLHPSETNNNPLLSASQEVKNLFLTLHVLFPHEVLPALDLLDRRLVTRFVVRSVPVTQPPAQLPLPTTTTRAEDGDGNAVGTVPAGAENSPELEQEQEQVVDGRTHQQLRPLLDQEIQQSAEPQTPTSTRPKDPNNIVYYVRSSASNPTAGRPRQQTAAPIEVTHYEVRLTAWNCSCPAFTFGALAALDFRIVEPEDTGDIQRSDGEGVRTQGWRFGGLGLGESGQVPVCKHLLACLFGERVGILRGYVEERIVGREEAAGWAAGWGG
ncbi:MAG: hypothetical protein MMC33_002626 [Icmadophila ericetorum]|nr:hypothetical protein [Icmadophila ericetorum]